jgi:HSF-type DNA-binding
MPAKSTYPLETPFSRKQPPASYEETPAGTTDEPSLNQQFPSNVSSLYRDYSLSVPTFEESTAPALDRFPEKLYQLLNRADAENFDHVISWEPHGRSFAVRQLEMFKSLLFALMPGMTRWKSFQRQLHFWGFRKLPSTREAKGYFHEYFLRYRPHLLIYMQRDSKSKRNREEELTEVELDFYAMPFLTPLESTTVDVSDPGESSRASLNTGSLTLTELESKPAARNTLADSTDCRVPQSDELDEHGYELPYHDRWAGRAAFAIGNIETIARESDDEYHPTMEPWDRTQLVSEPLDKTMRGALWSERSDNEEAPLRSYGLGEATRTTAGTPLTIGHTDDDGAEPNGQIKLRPLPPVPSRQGEILHEIDESVPVAQHPSFVKSGPQEFYYVAGFDAKEGQQHPPSPGRFKRRGSRK